MSCTKLDPLRKRTETPVEVHDGEPPGVQDNQGIRRESGKFIDLQTRPQIVPEPPVFAFSTVVDGTVIEHLPDGFVIENEHGVAVTIETFCPSEALGLRRGDKVSVFGGPGKQGKIASGSIDRIYPDGRRQMIPDGNCR